jgi:hypothetical protein
VRREGAEAMKIETLTAEQQAKVQEYRDRYFALATNTDPADRPRAEAAARRVAEIGGVKVKVVVWVLSPEEGAKVYGDRWASLRDSLWASLWASCWIAFYAFGRDVLGVRYEARDSELLTLYREMLESAFAFWVVPGMVILCERPARCEVQDGRLVGIEWREEQKP